MVLVRSEDFNIERIAESGQCFRLTRGDAPGRWRLAAHGRILEMEERGGGAALRCDTAEYGRLWRAYFDLDTDYGAFRAAVPKTDRFLSRAVRFGQGIRILRQDPWETLVTFLISQRKNIPAIRGAVEKLCAAAGTPLAEGIFSFPSAEAVAALPRERLAACSLGYRAPYVEAAARMTAAGALDLEGLRRADDETLRQTLLAVPGVGPKVASCVMLFGYHRLNGFPRDVWMNRVIDGEYGGAFPLERYGGFAGVIQQYLFYYARSGPGRGRRCG